MSEGLNNAQLLGNLGADPELRFTQGGQAVMNLRLCTNTRYKDRDGQWQDRQEWHAVVVWGPRAEALSKILTKGSSCYIEGEIRTSSYDDKEGVKRYKTEIHANKVILTGGKPEGRGRDDDDRGRSDDRGRDDRRGGNAAEDTRRRADERHSRAREEDRNGRSSSGNDNDRMPWEGT
jgi:single-strand DNA-binding protein